MQCCLLVAYLPPTPTPSVTTLLPTIATAKHRHHRYHRHSIMLHGPAARFVRSDITVPTAPAYIDTSSRHHIVINMPARLPTMPTCRRQSRRATRTAASSDRLAALTYCGHEIVNTKQSHCAHMVGLSSAAIGGRGRLKPVNTTCLTRTSSSWIDTTSHRRHACTSVPLPVRALA